MNKTSVIGEINNITSELIYKGISKDQNFPSSRRDNSGIDIIDWGKSDNISIALKNIPYIELYDELVAAEEYSIMLLDESLIQFMYLFDEKEVIKHRLAFYPNPHVEKHQENRDLNDTEQNYSDLLYRNIVPFPIRFDYSNNNDDHIDIEHAKSHVTFGHYKNCRIPINTPVSPFLFIDFVLRNIYSTFYKNSNLEFNKKIKSMQETITNNERKILHFNLLY